MNLRYLLRLLFENGLEALLNALLSVKGCNRGQVLHINDLSDAIEVHLSGLQPLWIVAFLIAA